jgi:excisionase family DNA binding protein
MITVLTVEEVSQFLRIHRSTVYRLLRKRSIPAFKLGSDWRFNQESIERWVKQLEVPDGVPDGRERSSLSPPGARVPRQ